MIAMNRANHDACRAWQLLMKFFFAQREHLPGLSAEFDLSPTLCHVLHLIEPFERGKDGRYAYEDWRPFLNLADASYWNTELTED